MSLRIVTAVVLLVVATCAPADDLFIEVSGVNDRIAANVRAHVGSNWVSGAQMSSEWLRERYRNNAKAKVRAALRPYGYYSPSVETHLTERGDDRWLLQISVAPGEPVRVRDLRIEITGDGAQLEQLRSWRSEWPLGPGTRLDQTLWRREKENAIDLAKSEGYLSAQFTKHVIELDLESNRADLALSLETGPRYVMGEVRFQQDIVRNQVLAAVPRFRQGDPYRSWYVDKLRTDLWKTGYFSEVQVVEQRRDDAQPPRVDLTVTATQRNRATHQVTVGYGSDSEFRGQYDWTLHRLSMRGDSLTAGAGWQQRDKELRISSEYLLPRRVSSRQYWLANGTFRREKQELLIQLDRDDNPAVLATGRVDDLRFRWGRTKLRSVGRSEERLAETFFLDYLRERDDFSNPELGNDRQGGASGTPLATVNFNKDVRSVALGVEYNLPVVQGSGFRTTGHHERAWLIHADDAWGSQIDFTQLYLSTRWNLLLADRWMLLLRGEAGYSDADVEEFEVRTDGATESISVTRLPNFYRFRAGGSRSVRGYEFELLSDNGIGSNHILTASAELEYNFHGDWSAAVFYDVGNAFNHRSEPDLKRGAGVGLRWHTVAGSIRLDLARALDFAGEPWTVHFTIGTSLL